MIYTLIKILLLAFIQNVSFSMVSRSRNRDNMTYHIIAAVFSNTLWLLTIRELVIADLDLILAIPYTTGTVLGSVFGVKISMWIERKLDARSDSHLTPSKP